MVAVAVIVFPNTSVRRDSLRHVRELRLERGRLLQHLLGLLRSKDYGLIKKLLPFSGARALHFDPVWR